MLGPGSFTGVGNALAPPYLREPRTTESMNIVMCVYVQASECVLP